MKRQNKLAMIYQMHSSVRHQQNLDQSKQKSTNTSLGRSSVR